MFNKEEWLKEQLDWQTGGLVHGLFRYVRNWIFAWLF